VSAGTSSALTVKASTSLSAMILPLGLAAQLAHGAAALESGAALATLSAPCWVPVELSLHVIAKALAGTLPVAALLTIAAPVTESVVTVLRDERTLPETVVPLVHGAVSETVVATLHVTVALVIAIVARTGAVMFALRVPVVAPGAAETESSTAKADAVAVKKCRSRGTRLSRTR
jgi:hypothetical protein